MQVQTFDQYEFCEGGSSEFWLAIAFEPKGLRGKKKGLTDFFEVTQKYEGFAIRSNTRKLDISSQINLIDASEGIGFELDYLILFVNKQTSLNIDIDQDVYLIFKEWCDLDIIWEDKDNYYRLMWFTTA